MTSVEKCRSLVKLSALSKIRWIINFKLVVSSKISLVWKLILRSAMKLPKFMPNLIRSRLIFKHLKKE